MVFTQGPRCGGAGSLRGPRRRQTLTAASKGRPEKEGLETEAQRAIGSGPCRDSGRRVLAGERESGLGGAGGPPGRASVHPTGHTPSAPLALPSLAKTCSALTACVGGRLQRCLPTQDGRVWRWQVSATGHLPWRRGVSVPKDHRCVLLTPLPHSRFGGKGRRKLGVKLQPESPLHIRASPPSTNSPHLIHSSQD